MKFFFLLILFTIMILGCTTEGQTQPPTDNIIIPVIKSNGLNVINFTTSFTTLRIQESTSLNLKLKNIGYFPVENVTSLIYGYGDLEKTDLINKTERLLPNAEIMFTWLLKAPITLSHTESTSYTVNARLFYWYNFSGFQQVAFVPTTYVGDDPTISSVTRAGPLSVSIQTINPLRSVANKGVNFSITIEITNNEKGRVNYYNDPQRSFHLNELILKVPSNWVPLDNLSAWQITTIDGETEYKLNFDKLQEDYYKDIYPCTLGCCCDCSETNANQCILINTAISNLWLIRGEKARILLLFNHADVTEPTIDIVEVNGNYGYEIDSSDFTSPITITVRGD